MSCVIWQEVRCEDCGYLTTVCIVYPGDTDRDTCANCGSDNLDWECAEPGEPPAPDPDSLYERDR